MEGLKSEKIKTSEKLCKTCKYGITFGAVIAVITCIREEQGEGAA